MPTRFHLFHTSRRSRADKQSLGDSPRDTVFQTYFPCNDSISSSSSNNSDTSVSTSDSSKGDDLSSSERTKMNKVLGEGPPASVTHSRAKSVTEDKGKGFFRSRTFPKENPSSMNQPAHETGSGVRVLSPELTHRLMHNTELRRSGARLAQKDIWVTSLTDDESFFHTLLKLPTEDKCLSPTLLKYFFMAHTFIIDSHALLAFLFNNYFDEKSTQQSRDRILVLLELWIQVSREDFKRIEVSFLFCNWHSLLFNSTVDGDKPKADRLKSVWERQELETYEPDLVRELSDREYDRKFSPKTIWDKLSEAHIACQMTLLDAQYFKKVRIYDLLQTDYSKHPDSTLVPLKNHFVKMSLWIASELISRPKKKKELLAKVLRVAELFLRMKNLNGVAYIVHALMLPVVARQQKMWKRLIDMPEEKIWTEISLLMERDSDGSYYWLNRKLRKTDGYFIPPFHVIMTELEEQADLNESIGLQNLPQVWRVGAILDYFQRNQSTSLSIRRDDKLQNFLHEMTVSNNIGKLWDVSKEVDPTPGFTPSADVENKLWYYSQLSPDEAEEILRSARPKSFIVWADLNSYCLSYTNRTLMVKHAHIDHKMAQAGTLRARQSSFSLMDVEHHNVTALVSRLPFLYDLRPILASNCAKNKGKMLANAPQMEHEFWNRCKHYGRADVFFSINAKLDKSDLEMLESQAAFSIASGDFETLGNLIGAGLPTTTKFEGNQTLLHIAAEKNLPRLIDLTMDFNARYWGGALDINASDETGWTALHVAADKHHLQVIKSLLTHGARVSCLNNSGASPLHYVVRKKPETTEKKEGLSQLRKAPVSEAEEQFTAILNMLIERGAALNSQDFNGNTPLHSAINNSNEVAAKILLNRGALNQKNKRGDSSRTLAQARQVTGTGSWNSADPTMTDILLITEGSKMEKISDFKKVNSREVEQYLKQDLKRGVMPFDHHFSGIDYTALVGMDHETGVVLVFVAKEIPGQSTKVLLRHKKGEELFLLERISPVSALRISLNMFLQGLDFKMTPGESLTRSILLSEKELHANATSVSILLVSEAAYNLRLVLADESKPSDAYTEFVRFMAGTRTRALSFGSLGADSSTREEKGMSAHAMVAYHPKHPSTSVVFYNIPTLPPEERKVQIQETPVIIVYLEASNIDTSMLLNHHAQTMIVVQPAKTSGEYRLAVVSRSSFGVYEPALPFPPIFSLDQDFKNYLFDKLINACVLASSAGFSFISEEFRDRALFEVYSASKNATTTATDFSNVPKHKMYKVYPSKIVGSGATSMVFQALNRQTKKEYCAKIVDKSLISTDEARAADKEVQILAEMSHQNVIKLIDSYTVDNSLYLVLELCRGGSIWEDVEQNGLFSEKQAANVMFQVMDALQYIHSRHISHRDLKPQNILYGDTLKRIIKVIDFGFGKNTKAERLNYSIAGTEEYMAPEVMKRSYDYFKIDIFSCGCVLHYLLFGKSALISGESPSVLYGNISAGKYPLPVSSSVKKLFTKLLAEKAEDRYTAEEALNDPWFTENSAQ